MARTAKKKHYYVDNKKFYEALKAYKAMPEDKRKISDYIGECLMKICKELSMAPNWRGYSYRDEMVDAAIENTIYAIRFFDPEKSDNPFGYFTLVAWRAFIRKVGDEKKQNYIKHKNFEKAYVEGGGMGIAPNEYSHEVIEKFETKLAETKKKQKEAGLLKIAKDDV